MPEHFVSLDSLHKLPMKDCFKETINKNLDTRTIDGYKVIINTNKNEEKKINIIKLLNSRLDKLLMYMKKKYIINNILIGSDLNTFSLAEDGSIMSEISSKSKEELLDYYTYLINNVDVYYKKNNFIENVIDTGKACVGEKYSSYVIKKGEIFSICMENEHNNLYDEEFLWHVFVHEISHISDINSTAHDSLFYNAFLTLKRNSFEAGLSPLLQLNENNNFTYCNAVKMADSEFYTSNPSISEYNFKPFIVK